MKRYLEGGIELWWCDSAQREEVKELISWLKDFENRPEEDNDDGACCEVESSADLAWEVDSYYTNNAYLITGMEGKSSLVAHLARSLHHKLIEINNADQEVANLISHVQEATQSRILRGSRKKTKAHSTSTLVCASFPILLLDDADVNTPSAAPFLPRSLSGSASTASTVSTASTASTANLSTLGGAGYTVIEEWGATSPIGALTTLDCWFVHQKPTARTSYLKSVKQLILQSKAPILITTTTPSVQPHSLHHT